MRAGKLPRGNVGMAPASGIVLLEPVRRGAPWVARTADFLAGSRGGGGLLALSLLGRLRELCERGGADYCVVEGLHAMLVWSGGRSAGRKTLTGERRGG